MCYWKTVLLLEISFNYNIFFNRFINRETKLRKSKYCTTYIQKALQFHTIRVQVKSHTATCYKFVNFFIKSSEHCNYRLIFLSISIIVFLSVRVVFCVCFNVLTYEKKNNNLSIMIQGYQEMLHSLSIVLTSSYFFRFNRSYFTFD